ncbi:hypothetical protein EQW78_08230 [Oerskovia turbata]|uniref:DUF4386 family protein n=1 Tax=Oerskovia turbata TaxID=1713 RepID=A0A4Q1KW38_9CELL|nr:hypothetical protein [Oerskovia turbata]RXR26798.1 hypothetical protein EQW73_04735 [Oerskovia turbata]RXR34531.1 hypothetical protein EQW78_08230 [Oerskovia turbata]TGJ97806.1 hypothetical protein DLJ96_07825 [Actinotalea fermentans ATCC 43279 = JCM 9966 = DSM 3133]
MNAPSIDRTHPDLGLVRPRTGAVLLAVAGVVFLVFPLLRPWVPEDVTTPELAAAFASGRWIAAHLCGAAGFWLLPAAFLGLHERLAGTRGQAPASGAVVTGWLGAGLVLPYFGAEVFGVHAIARNAVTTGSLDFLTTIDAVRMQPVAMTLFGLGLLAVGASGLLAAVAVWRGGLVPRWPGIPLATGMVLYLPQFFTPPAGRIAHGVLLAVGCWLVAWALSSSAEGDLDRPATPVRRG